MNVSNINSGIHARGHASPRKVCDENKRKKKRQPCKIFLITKDVVWLLQKLDVTDVDELQVNNSSHTKGSLVNGGMGAKRMVF